VRQASPPSGVDDCAQAAETPPAIPQARTSKITPLKQQHFFNISHLHISRSPPRNAARWGGYFRRTGEINYYYSSFVDFFNVSYYFIVCFAPVYAINPPGFLGMGQKNDRARTIRSGPIIFLAL
jgi:hypothetical protein